MSGPPAPSIGRRLGGGAWRLGLLVVIIAGSGIGAGLAVGYPLSHLEIDTYQSTQLDQQGLAGNFDPNDALLDEADFNGGLKPDDPKTVMDILTFTGQLRIGTGTSFCGKSPDITNVVDNRIAPRVFSDSETSQSVVSMVVRFKTARDANIYIRNLDNIVSGCTHFFRGTGDDTTRLNLSDDRRNPPVTDYVNRTLLAEKGGEVSEVTFFQVGDSVVELQYVGSSRPVDGFMDGLERSILRRVAPKQFGTRIEVAGELPLPPEPTTSTTEPPPTAPPETEAPTTTTKKKK